MTESKFLMDDVRGFRHAEDLIRQVVDELRPRFHVKPGLRNSMPELDEDEELNEADENRDVQRMTNVEVTYSLVAEPGTGEPVGDNASVFGQVEALWERRGYDTLIRVVNPPPRRLCVRDPRDGFTISLNEGQAGNLWLTAASGPVVYTRAAPPPPGIF